MGAFRMTDEQARLIASAVSQSIREYRRDNPEAYSAFLETKARKGAGNKKGKHQQ